jgi:PII-like signaling protein
VGNFSEQKWGDSDERHHAALLDKARESQLKGVTVFRDGCLSEGTIAA